MSRFRVIQEIEYVFRGHHSAIAGFEPPNHRGQNTIGSTVPRLSRPPLGGAAKGMHTNDLNRTIFVSMFLAVLVIVMARGTGCQTPIPTASHPLMPSPTHNLFAF